MSNIKERLLKNSKLDLVSSLEDSEIYNNKDMISTQIPMVNVALSGGFDGGISPGMLMLAGPSKHFKSGFALMLASAYIKKYPDAVILFYDSEFGMPEKYFATFGIPKSSVIHCPVTDIEQLKHDIVSQLQEIKRNDRVFIVIDSVGNIASKKETEDALDGKSVADMSRAKQLKSLFRMITPHLTIKNIPLVAINHVYQEIGLYPKDIVSGGTGSYYSANDIWIIGRQQDKDASGLHGFNFVINIEKSRFVQEKSKILINVNFDDGIDIWSGLFEEASEAGYIIKSGAWYQLVDLTTGEIIEKKLRRNDIPSSFYKELIEFEPFKKKVSEKYTLGQIKMNSKEEK